MGWLFEATSCVDEFLGGEGTCCLNLCYFSPLDCQLLCDEALGSIRETR